MITANASGEEVIQTYHKSLADWMTDRRSAGSRFAIDLAVGAQLLPTTARASAWIV